MSTLASAYGGYTPSPPRRPGLAAVLSVLGGTLILLAAFWWLWTTNLHATVPPTRYDLRVEALAIVGMIVGGITILCGYLLVVVPRSHFGLGLGLVLLSFLSLGTALVGALFLGFLLTLIGGVLALAFHPDLAYYPSPPVAYTPGVPPAGLVCRRCGGLGAPGTRFCPYCGGALP
jgi:drug/metabolite transporter (DMT)-like permease